MELSHKLFNGQEVAFIMISHPPGDILLEFKAESVVFSAGQVVQPVSDQADKFEILLEPLILPVG